MTIVAFIAGVATAILTSVVLKKISRTKKIRQAKLMLCTKWLCEEGIVIPKVGEK